MSAPEQPTSAGRAGCPRPEEGQPMNAPEVWWSPSLAEDLSQGGLIERTGPDLWHQENGLWHRLDELPADAVRLVPATLNSELKVGAVPDTGQATEPEHCVIEAGGDPIVAATDLLFEHRHTLPTDVLRSMAGIWVCASAAKYGEPYERFWEDDLFAGHDTDECEAENATTPSCALLGTDTTPKAGDG